MSAERLHHPYSPSKLGNLELSSRWTPRENTSTAASEAGVRQHDAAEDPIDLDSPALEDHEAEAVASCKMYRDKVVAQHPGCRTFKEVYVRIDDEKIVDENGTEWLGTTAGYLDFAVLSADKKTLHVLDYKFGKWAVEPAESNLQGWAYILGLVRENPTIETATVHFLLPHREEIDVATFKRDQFDAMRLRIVAVVRRAIEARKTGECSGASVGTCLFCALPGKCKKLDGFVLQVSKKYEPLLVPENLTPSTMHKAENAKGVMGVAMVIGAWAEAVRRQITEKAIDSDDWLPGGYVLRSRSDTEVKDWKGFLREARAKGVTPAAIKESIKIRVEPIYKHLRSLAPRGKKEEAEDIFRDEMLAKGLCAKKPAVYFLERLK